MNFKKIFIAIVGVCSIASCTSDFEETNTDPNRLQAIYPSTLLSPIIYEVASHGMYRSWSHNNHFMQDIVAFPSNTDGIQRYDFSDDIGSSSWNAYFRWMKNARDMEAEAVKVADPNYQAIAITLRAWMASNLTDLFGPIPYFDSSKGDEGVLKPKFDKQEEVYKSLLEELEYANSLYDVKRPMNFRPDILFVDQSTYWLRWQKFTNSLHLRLLLRVSNKAEMNAYTKMANIINDPIKYPVIENNQESVILDITGVTPNVSPWSRIQDFTLSRKMASFFLDNLVDFKDPRLPLYATEAYRVVDKKKVYIGYKGIPSAWDGPDSQFDYEASGLNNIIAKNPTKAPILTYAELMFIKAELGVKGYLSDAKLHYEEGVKSAITQYGIEVPADYFENEKAAFDGTLERVMLQKYYALYMVDYQQWFEHKRTGLPKLPKTQSMLNDGNMPNRFPYPLSIRSQNKDEYEKVKAEMGGDDINVKMWWQN
ncbi:MULTISPECIES: SusD/RagB family nutrient-binding outer membrane lipoprotein [Myroides]|uniref:SusD/RagB family nutrient-binding outer membrane lipoprotein n=1 Tax=Myroides albus TaxID=2562892 RepID=A0A6I3LHJ0_9FLAO|nr:MULTISPECIES: SusD/RagB family nutrient-binding outer membrane lipoprotein [Myroides]MTG97264.1 SusD/RagB family nutrient-binding outer membrane lipoprotein [Myroides albus]MVX34283.1 SusD/RagB family nutrient-binding outer membrane lipoprotein [Myroides sp. LoEW2-1]UVD80648.1 SusD/RagB family nutrient-binding outer membrane lipoprotein [Myroides albus]